MRINYLSSALALTLLFAPSCDDGAKEIPDVTQIYPNGPGNEDPQKPEVPDTPDQPDVTTDALELVKVTSTSACIAVEYKVAAIEGAKVISTGLCWSAESQRPDIGAAHQRGPVYPGEGKTFMQGISNAMLDYDKAYNFRIYAQTDGDILYSPTFTASLGEEPSAITFNWSELYEPSLPESVKVFKTTDKLNGRPFNAWYAIADLSAGDVELKVNVPSSAATVDVQAAADPSCLILTNAGYFYEGRHVGIKATGDGTGVSGNISSVRGSLRSGDAEYSEMYEVTRGAFGVDASGRASVVWAGTSSNVNRFYDRPLPSIRGEAKYAPVSETNPCEPLDWKPKYAVSAGPVLLKDGKCPFDLMETAKGNEYFMSNFEVIPYDIFSKTLTPDRTAVGVTEDGRVILFICDGRYAASDGARIDETALIMKGLGCVEALNLDGGGSTGMMVCGTHVNDITTGGNRAVVSTIGFYRK